MTRPVPVHGPCRPARIAILLVASGVLLPASEGAAQGATSDEALRMIVETAYRSAGAASFGRKQSFTARDWADSVRLIRVVRDETPILGVPDLRTSQLEIVGIARKDEIFAVTGTRHVAPASGTAGAGEWYELRLIDDRTGWLLATPVDAAPFAEEMNADPVPNAPDGRLVALIVLVGLPVMLAVVLVLLGKASGGDGIDAS